MPGAGSGKKEQCEMRGKERERDDMRWHNNSRHIADTEGVVCGLMWCVECGAFTVVGAGAMGGH